MSTASKLAILLAAPSADEDDEPNEDAVAWCDHKLQAVRECLEGLRLPTNHWCTYKRDHTEGCLAAQQLYERLKIQ